MPAAGLILLHSRSETVSVGAGLTLAGTFTLALVPIQLPRGVIRQALPVLAQPWRYTIDAAGVMVDMGLGAFEWRWKTLYRDGITRADA